MNSFTENEQNTVVQSPCLAELYNHNPFLFLRRSWYDGWYSRATQEVNIGPLRLVILALSALLRKDRGQWVQRKKLIKILKIGESLRLGLNESVTKQILERYAELFDKVEEHPLTEAQRLAVACDEDANLVIAGAGTGKTSTIVAKIGLLLQSGQCKPSEILAISFTRKSAMDLAERVKKKLRVELDVFTFHKLGLDIVSKCEGAKPALAAFVEDPALRSKHVHNIIFQLQKNKQFSNDLSSFWAYFRLPLKQDWDFGSMAEYANWLRSNNLVSLDGFQKKSYEECVIANWLILNGVEFEYERPYEHSTRTVDYRQYRPDFYLTKYGLYVEHFGVDKSGNTAPYIDSTKSMVKRWSGSVKFTRQIIQV
ncbi:MAG: UvrD-helicase domain-containing protein [Ignavibacteria bacterium]|nr:UvrD-helicase domain-containing protein [Ignavibacteria bacterium]